jgi:NAD(P)-dependent dehydrogenase (short-subunit alcohol dehydrogenase family)
VAGPAPALNLEGRTAVVLGGTSGIGRAISLGLAAAGADVVAAGRRTAEVVATADAIEAAGRKTLRQTADVTRRDTLEALRDATLAAFGKVDILVNCAGKTNRRPVMDYDDASWNDDLDTNLTGTLRGCQIFGKPMLERGYGRIVNIASLTTFVAFHETPLTAPPRRRSGR